MPRPTCFHADPDTQQPHPLQLGLSLARRQTIYSSERPGTIHARFAGRGRRFEASSVASVNLKKFTTPRPSMVQPGPAQSRWQYQCPISVRAEAPGKLAAAYAARVIRQRAPKLADRLQNTLPRGQQLPGTSAPIAESLQFQELLTGWVNFQGQSRAT